MGGDLQKEKKTKTEEKKEKKKKSAVLELKRKPSECPRGCHFREGEKGKAGGILGEDS